MRLRNRDFPHPVLKPDNDDLISSIFSSNITLLEQSTSPGEIEFSVKNLLKNADLQKLIIEKKAHFAIHFECASTMQRLLFFNTFEDFTVSIPETKLNKRVEVNFFILASEEINDYVNSNSNPVFSGVSFKIQKGDILAYSASKTINIEKKPISNTNSIFKFTRGSDTGVPSMSFSFQENQIEITLPNTTYERVSSLKAYGEDSQKILITMFYMPALIDAFHHIHSLKDEDFDLQIISDTDWFRTLEKRLANSNTDILEVAPENITNLSFNLLFDEANGPLSALENLLEIEKGGDEDNES